MPIACREIRIAPRLEIGGPGFVLIAGPCVLESEAHALRLAAAVAAVCRRLRLPFVFKASFDKANRSSGTAFRGPGLRRGLEILRAVKAETGVPVLSDVHETGQVAAAAEVLDIIQIPAFLCRQTDLVVEAARTGRPLNLKKGQFLAPGDMRNVLDKVLAAGNERVILTERGVSFGYNNLVLDPRAIPIMKAWGFPVIVDASHAVQRPGGAGDRSGGDAAFIPTLALAGTASGADGLFLEVHERPARARSDKDNMLNLKDLEGLLRTALRVRRAIRPDAGGAGPGRPS